MLQSVQQHLGFQFGIMSPQLRQLHSINIQCRARCQAAEGRGVASQQHNAALLRQLQQDAHAAASHWHFKKASSYITVEMGEIPHNLQVLCSKYLYRRDHKLPEHVLLYKEMTTFQAQLKASPHVSFMEIFFV